MRSDRLPFEIEKRYQWLKAKLKQAPLDVTKVYLIGSFFASFKEAPLTTRESYYIELIPILLHHITHSSLQNFSPPFFNDLRRTLAIYSNNFAKQEEKTSLSEKADLITHRLAVVYFYLGELESALNFLLNLSSTAQDAPLERIGSLNEEDRKLIDEIYENGADEFSYLSLTLERFKDRYPSIAPYMKAIQENWAKRKDWTRTKVNCLLVGENLDEDLEPQGILENLWLTIKERSADAEEDEVKFHNLAIHPFDPFLMHSKDSLLGVRNSLRKSGYSNIVKKCYSYTFSLLNKIALYTGESLGLSMATLAYTQLVNSSIERLSYSISGDVVFTGVVGPEADLLPLDELGLKAKVKRAFYSHLKFLVLPQANLVQALKEVESLRSFHPRRRLNLVGVENVSEALDDGRFTKTEKNNWLKVGAKRAVHKRKSAVVRAISLVVVLVVAAFALLPRFLHHPKGEPTTWSLEGRKFLIHDEHGKCMAIHDMGAPIPEGYHQNFEKAVRIKDTDGDGKNEVVLCSFKNKETNPEFWDTIYYFEEDGKLKWRRRISSYGNHYGIAKYTDLYHLRCLTVVDLDGDGIDEIIGVFGYYPLYPCMTVCLDLDGDELGRYWNCGHFLSVETFDIDGDGVKEIILGGTNNSYRSAVLVALDFRYMEGASPPYEEGRFGRALDLTRGTQKLYVRFPRDDIVKALDAWCMVGRLVVDENGNLTVVIHAPYIEKHGLNYVFNKHLELISFIPEDSFMVIHRKYELEGKLDRTMDEGYWEDMKKVEYWDGDQWVPTYATNKYLRIK